MNIRPAELGDVDALAEQMKAVAAHELVGAIDIHPTGIDGVQTLGMSILRDFRGQGWGRRLVEAALDAARARGVRKVTLEVFSDNGRAVALYASTGFEVEGFKRAHYPRRDGSFRSAILMARFLREGTDVYAFARDCSV